MSSLAAPPAVRWVVRTLEDAGFETWAVGGAVRDLLAGHPSGDWDFATRARPAEVRRTFPRTVPIGIDHGTVGVLARDGTLYEVTTFRKDVETFGRHAVVEFAERLEDDLARRDFTINAVAWHPLRDEVRDPYGGVRDLDAGVLRTVGRAGDRFAEDYLRVLRALRFAGRYDLTVEDATWRALAGAVEHLRDLSPERVREELVKILEKDPRPSRALALYAASGALEVAHPEMAGMPGSPPGRAEGRPDAWSKALAAVDRLPAARPLLRLATLLLDADAPSGDPGAQAFALLARLRFSNADTDRVVGLVRTGASPLPSPGADGAAIRRWLAASGPERVADLVRIRGVRARVADAIAEGTGRAEGPGGEALRVASSARAVRAEMRRRPPLAVGDLALDGRALIRMGLKPGRRFGEILDALLDRVLEEPGLNDLRTLETLVRREVAPDLFSSPGADAEAPGPATTGDR